MIRNYIFTVIRQIRKNKTFSFVNIVGLGVGMAACLLIAQYVYFHLNFDQFHSESDHIYRLQAETTKDGESIGTTISFGPLAGPELVAQSPLVSNYTRFWSINYMNNSIIRKTEKGVATFDQPGVFLSEKNTFEIFNLPIVKGSLDKFGEPNKMVIDEWTAGRYFLPEEDPIGQNLELSGNQGAKMYEVVAVMKNLPENTHLDFNVLLSFDSYKNYFRPNLTWTSGNNLIYYKVEDPSKTDEILATFEPMFEKNAGES
ncbi:MAG: ABC transporter permease, partial [bacterium]|nr:ABC transporter permease [bacterium]